jgi:hypothetical protein
MIRCLKEDSKYAYASTNKEQKRIFGTGGNISMKIFINHIMSVNRLRIYTY